MTKHSQIFTGCLVLTLVSGCCTSRQWAKNAGLNVAPYQFDTNSLQTLCERENEPTLTNADILILSGGARTGPGERACCAVGSRTRRAPGQNSAW